MKKILIFTIILITSQNIFAQIEITPFGGWHWTGSIPAYRQDIKVSDEGNYGIRIGAAIRDQQIIEFEWNHTNNSATFREYNNGIPSGDLIKVPLTMNYYMLGVQHELTYEEALVPYGLFNLGLVDVRYDGTTSIPGSSDIYFVAGLGGGIKYFISDKIGIRLQARLLLPMQFGGVGFGCGIGTGGGGCGAGVSTYTSIIQGDFTGGIILKLGE